MKIQVTAKVSEVQLHQVMQIWLAGNLQAHDFVAPDYWKQNYAEVAKQIKKATLILATENNSVLGFLGLVDGYIAGLFVNEDQQRRGIGTKLVQAAEQIQPELTLSVYQKNKNAVQFYHAHSFKILKTDVDEETNEIEYLMSNQ
ncbi:hypothetical protein A7K95_06410 [Pediococcus parvulus]|uniref:GNAT family N-acetyltransferase n=1 Tax=Pediococcus parvulus TaxID=54062 RepID=A0AAP5TDC0_9LACO|nr:GNAT family N-acetyltransferase [Pediococcus parvulus]MDV7694526.1 GNAT family N-acetyltransferase [Pediococcus parvulus]OAD64144.1 hypothetical protein A7K95_06410 [Pediococcus parvulus]